MLSSSTVPPTMDTARGTAAASLFNTLLLFPVQLTLWKRWWTGGQAGKVDVGGSCIFHFLHFGNNGHRDKI